MTDKQLVEKARIIANKAALEINEIHAHRIDDVEDVRPYCDALRLYANGLLVDADVLRVDASHYYARVEKPKRAAALDKCDDVLQRLDRVRDIIARAISDDAAVSCDESDAEIIIGCVDNALDYIKQASTYATEKIAQEETA